ncbi:MAG: hypothetical protein ABIL05_04205, partial [candidate division WOR-3 bacterium]
MFFFFIFTLIPLDSYQDLNVGARPRALGFAVTSQVGDPANIFFNPAGLSAMKEGCFVVHYRGEGFDSLGRIDAISLILPDLALSYFPVANSEKFVERLVERGKVWEDERYRIDEYIITVTSRTANASFSDEEYFRLGINLKYLTGHYSKIEWSYIDSLWSKPEYIISDGNGYSLDGGILIKVAYINLGLLLKDFYGRMKWQQIHNSVTDRLRFI